MLDLSTKQHRLLRAVVGGDPADAASLLSPAGAAALDRLAIYRNHFLESLIQTLAAAYPVTRALVGERYFGVLARRYILAEPPNDPRLHLYGGGLANATAESPECAALPYLPDVARLEWALREAAEARDEPALGVPEVCRALAALGPHATLTFSACLRLVQCAWPADLIWRAHENGELVGPREIEQESRWLEVSRDSEGPYFIARERSEFVLRARLLSGDSIATACEAALADSPTFEVSRALTDLVELCLIVGVEPA